MSGGVLDGTERNDPFALQEPVEVGFVGAHLRRAKEAPPTSAAPPGASRLLSMVDVRGHTT